MRKLKVFGPVRGNGDELEKIVNSWLEKYQSCRILHANLSTTTIKPDSLGLIDYCFYSILYEEG